MNCPISATLNPQKEIVSSDAGTAEEGTRLLPKFRFEVDLGTELIGIAFQEVSGLDVDHQIIEYRASNRSLFSTEKMPGITKYGNVILKKGVFTNDNTFWEWYNRIQLKTIKRSTVIIKLLDEAGNITMQWQLNNAWPTKIISTDLKSDGTEVAIETIEIAREYLTTATP